MSALSLEKDRADSNDGTWLFLYGPAMSPEAFARAVGGPTPTSYWGAIAEDAWLSFDARGLPFHEPARASLIIRDVNDQDAPRKGALADEGDPAYRRWVHDRCCPSQPFQGQLPPHAEGRAVLVTSSQLLAWQILHSTFGWTSLKTSPRLVPLTLRPQQKVKGLATSSNGTVVAHALVAKSANRAPFLQPIGDLQGTCGGAAAGVPCSKAYVSWLVSLRPYKSKTLLGQRITHLVVAPAFLLGYMPFAILKQPVPLFCARILELAIDAAWAVERLISPFLGSGHIDL